MFEKYSNRSGNKFVQVPLPKGRADLLVSDDGQVVSLTDGVLPHQINHMGEHFVYADLHDGPGEYLVSLLVLLGFSKLDPDFAFLSKVSPFHIDSDPDNLHPSNIGYRFECPIESPKHPGWFYIPFFTNYIINKDGVVYNERRDHPMFPCFTKRAPSEVAKNIKGGYARFTLSNSMGSFNIGRHRILALTFKPFPNCVDKLDVNHKNGVPGDDDLDNLEWATRQQNNIHAVNSGLRTQNVRTYVKNVFTGKEYEFASCAQAARKTGITPTELVPRLRWNQKVYPGGWMYKTDPNVAWRVPEDPQAEIDALPTPTMVYSKHIGTGEIRTHASYQACGVDLKLKSPQAVKSQIRSGRNRPYYGYLFKKSSDNTPWPEFTEDEVKRFLTVSTGRAREIVAKNKENEIVKRFASIHQARDEYSNVLRTAADVTKAILRKRNLNGVTLHYVT